MCASSRAAPSRVAIEKQRHRTAGVALRHGRGALRAPAGGKTVREGQALPYTQTAAGSADLVIKVRGLLPGSNVDFH